MNDSPRRNLKRLLTRRSHKHPRITERGSDERTMGELANDTIAAFDEVSRELRRLAASPEGRPTVS